MQINAFPKLNNYSSSSNTTVLPDLDDMSQTQNMKSHRFIVY